jgi:hypothetical protein
LDKASFFVDGRGLDDRDGMTSEALARDTKATGKWSVSEGASNAVRRRRADDADE